MQQFAATEFVLSDNNLRSQLEQVELETGKRPAQLDAGGSLPFELEHVWIWFLELCSVRVEYRPISNTELDSFCRLHGLQLESVELEAIRVLDREWLLHKANTLGK